MTYLFGGQAPPNWDPTTPQVSGMEAPGGPALWLQAVYGVLAYENYAEGTVEPAMAKSITPVDPTTWTITLRPNVQFTDGTPFDAEAVKFNLERHQAKPESPQHKVSKAIASMTATSPTELTVKLAQPDVQFDRKVARQFPFVGSPTAIKADEAKFKANPVGAGPFVLKSYVGNATATFARNEKYWDSPRPYLDELNIKLIADNEQRYNALRSNQGHGMYFATPYTQLDQAKKDGFKVTSTSPGGGGDVFVVNHQTPPFNDLTARRALQAMLDVEGKEKTVDFGAASPLTNLFEEGSPYYDKSATIEGYNPTVAQKLIDEYATKTGKPLSFSFYTHGGTVPMASFYQAQLKQFKNLEVNIKTVAPSEYVAGLASGQFHVAGFPYAFGEPIGSTKNMFGTGGNWNFGKYSNPEVDRLLQEASGALELKERADIFRKVQRILIDDQAFVFHGESPELQAFAQSVQGLEFAVDGVPLWDRVWLKT